MTTTLQRRRQSDRDFLARMFLLTRAELLQLAERPQPAWRRVALRRAIARAGR